MAITFVAAETVPSATGASTLSVTKPTGTAEDDIIIAIACSDDGDDTNDLPSGFTAIFDGAITNGAGTNDSYYTLGYKIAGASEPASYTFSFASSVEPSVAGLATFRGVDTTNPLDVTPTENAVGDTAPTDHESPSITTVTNDCAILCCFGHEAECVVTTPETGFTMVIDDHSDWGGGFATGGAAIQIGWDIQDAAGASGVKTFTVDVTDSYTAVTVALRPLATGGEEIDRTLTDGVAMDDGQAPSFLVPMAAAFDLADGQDASRDLQRVAADLVTLADSPSVARTALRLLTVGVDMGDSLDASRGLVRRLLAGVDVTDDSDPARDLPRTMADSLALQDQASLALLVAMSDGVAAEDAIASARSLARVLGSSVVVDDLARFGGILAARLVDGVATTDSQDAARDIPRSLAELVVLSDSVNALREILLQDAVTTEDRVDTVSTLARTLGAGVDVLDGFQQAGGTFRLLQDAVTVEDREDAIYAIVRHLVDATSLEDAASAAFTIALATGVEPGDSQDAARTLGRLLADGTATTDDISRLVDASLELRDAIETGDYKAAEIIIGRVLDDALSLSDSLSTDAPVFYGLGVISNVAKNNRIETAVVFVR